MKPPLLYGSGIVQVDSQASSIPELWSGGPIDQLQLRRHRILEDAFPFGKRKIAGENNTTALIPVCKKSE